MIEITSKELETKIENKESMIVMFHSIVCEKCQTQKGILDYHKLNIYGVECDDNPDEIITKFGVDIVPHIRVYHFGNPIWDKEDAIGPLDLEIVKTHEKSIKTKL